MILVWVLATQPASLVSGLRLDLLFIRVIKALRNLLDLRIDIILRHNLLRLGRHFQCLLISESNCVGVRMAAWRDREGLIARRDSHQYMGHMEHKASCPPTGEAPATQGGPRFDTYHQSSWKISQRMLLHPQLSRGRGIIQQGQEYP